MPFPTILVPPLLELGRELIDKFIKDPDEAEKRKVELQELYQQGELKYLEYVLEKYRLESADRESARRREIEAEDSWTPRIIAAVVLSGWFVIQGVLLFTVIPQEMREIIMRTLGTLDAVLLGIIGYYFGSSAGSKYKSNLLSNKNE